MQTSNISYGSSVSKSRAPTVKETVYYSKHKTYKSETLHIILNMSKHHNRIVELKLRLLEEPGEKTFIVPHVHDEILSWIEIAIVVARTHPQA